MKSAIGLPEVVTPAAWEVAHDRLLAKEKEATRALDALAAERRTLPMVEIEKRYSFEGPDGTTDLLGLFDGRRQLIVYHYMFGPGGQPCVGCSMVIDNMGHPAHLHARDTSRVIVSRAPLAELEPFRQRMGWREPWFSSFDSDFNIDFGVTTPEGETFGLSIFLRDDDRIYRTYFTNRRGAEELGTVWSYLDRTPFGRQESWEQSPEGWPQTEPYAWWRLHDEYDEA
jgi:predicted dithiol-disulfide oxidoreductase (DUF899 family)